MLRAEIVASGYYVPENVLDNAFFVNSPSNPYLVCIGNDGEGNPIFSPERKMVTDESIFETTGIRERRRVSSKEHHVDLLEKAFSKTGFPSEELSGIVIGSVTDRGRFPSVACCLQERIGAKKVSNAFDVGAACSGFTHALDITRLMAQDSGGYYLAAGVEILTRIADYEELNCNLFGDGCGLVIVGPTKDMERGIIATDFMSDVSGKDWIYLDKLGKLRMPHGRRVFRRATEGMIDLTHRVIDKSGIPKSEISRYFPHQANGRIIEAIRQREDPENRGLIYRNIERYGNMSSATVPVALAEAIETGKVKKGDLVSMVDMGSGLAFGSALVRL